MKENTKFALPPPWCGSICRNAMSEKCIEDCAIKRDCSGFRVKPALRIEDMPRFPATADMTRSEKFTSVSVYLAKTVDHLQGACDEYHPVRRPHLDSAASGKVPANLKIKAVLSDIKEAVSPPATGKKRTRKRVRPKEVAGTAD